MATASNLDKTASSPLAAQIAEWASASLDALVMVDSNLRVHWINERASKLIEAHEELALDGAALGFVQPSEAVRLTAMLAGLAPSSAGTAILFADARTRTVVVDAQRLEGQAQPLFGLKLHWLRRRPQVNLPLLGAIHGLTKEEQATVGHIVLGHTVSDIAERTGKAPSTVRTHVKRVYAKMGVTSREALLTECSAFFSPRV